MIDLHIHSNYSDGCCSIAEIARKARSLRLKAIAIVDHSIEHPKGIDERKAKMRQEEIDDAASAYGIKIYGGIECGIDAAGNIHLPDYGFDFVIASVHEFVDGTSYYERVLACVENCEFDILGHAFSRRFGFETEIPEMSERLAEAIKDAGIAVEINASHRCPPDSFLQLCDELGIPYSIGSDAHSMEMIGNVGWCLEKSKKYMKRGRLFLP